MLPVTPTKHSRKWRRDESNIVCGKQVASDSTAIASLLHTANRGGADDFRSENGSRLRTALSLLVILVAAKPQCFGGWLQRICYADQPIQLCRDYLTPRRCLISRGSPF